MLTGAIPWLCILGTSQVRQVRGPRFLDKKHTHAGEGCSFSLRPRQAARLCHSQGRPEKILLRYISRQMCTTSNSLANPRLSQDVQNKRKRQPFLSPYGPPAPGLCRKSSSSLLLSLTRVRTEVVYIDNGRGRSRGRRKGNRSLKS